MLSNKQIFKPKGQLRDIGLDFKRGKFLFHRIITFQMWIAMIDYMAMYHENIFRVKV